MPDTQHIVLSLIKKMKILSYLDVLCTTILFIFML